MSELKLVPHPQFDSGKVRAFFEKNEWAQIEEVSAANYDLVTVNRAPLLCIDGRNAILAEAGEIDPRAPKIPGGLNAIALSLTGGDVVGFNHAAGLVKHHGFKPGTHGDQHEGDGCGLFKLWKNNQLPSAVYALDLPIYRLKQAGMTSTDWIRHKQVAWEGAHITLPGIHQEQRLVLNYFMGTTVLPSTDSFIYDKWLLRAMGVPYQRSLALISDTLKGLAPNTRIEIITR